DATGRRAALARRLGARRTRGARLIALYAHAPRAPEPASTRTLIEAVRDGWWYAAWLPSGGAVAALHVRPDEAARLRADPAAWRAALAGTRHLAAFAGLPFGPLRAA